MSLTRKQWEEMWEDIKVIQSQVILHVPFQHGIRRMTLERVEAIKDKIQQVIGQME